LSDAKETLHYSSGRSPDTDPLGLAAEEDGDIPHDLILVICSRATDFLRDLVLLGPGAPLPS